MNKEKNKTNKIIKILIFLLAVFYFLFIFYTYENSHLQNSSEELQSDKIVDFQSVEIIPYKVKVGDKQTTTVKIVSTEEVEKVFAQIPFEGSYDEVSLKLISGDGFDGIWQCEWIAHNTLTKEYTTTITAITKNSTQEKVTSTWWDDTETTWLEGWSNRRKITVTENSGSTLTDYQVPIDMTTALYDNTDLLASWHFSEGSGTYVKDSSGNRNNGIITGATWTTNKEGESNSALSFDGTSDYIVTESFSNSAEISVFCWMNITSDDSWIVNKRDNVSDKQWQLIHYLNTLKAEIYGGSTSVALASTSYSIVDTGWRYVGFVTNGVNGGYVKLYIDGEVVDTQTLTGDMKLGSREARIGQPGFEGLAHLFSGSLDEVRIYDRILSDDEINQLYGEGKGRLDMNDLRFTSADGITQLSYWLENDSKAWVKIPSISASSATNIYYYSENPNASSVSSGVNTFDFFDDFSSSSFSSYYNRITGGCTGSCTTSDTMGTISSTSTTYYDFVYGSYLSSGSTGFCGDAGLVKEITLPNTTSSIMMSYNAKESAAYWAARRGVVIENDADNYGPTACNDWPDYEWLSCSYYGSTNQTTCGSVPTIIDSWSSFEHDISAYNGETVRIRLVNADYSCDYCNMGDHYLSLWVDDIKIYKEASPEPTYSISSQGEIEPTRSGVTGVSGGGALMF